MSATQFWFNMGFSVVTMAFSVGGLWWLRASKNRPPQIWVLLGILATFACLSIMALQLTLGMLAG